MFRVILNLFQDLSNDLTDAETLKSIQGRQVQQDFKVLNKISLTDSWENDVFRLILIKLFSCFI